MYQHFIKNNDMKKVEMFYYLSLREEVSIQELISQFNISRSSIKRYIADLNICLSHISSTNPTGLIAIKQTSSFDYFLTVNNHEELLSLYPKIQLYFLQISPTFQLFDLLFINNALTVYEISETLLFSENYCYKVIKQLNNILKLFSLSIEKNKKDSTFFVFGTEPNIRFVYLVLFVTPFQSEEWPFSKLSHSYLKESYSNEAKKILGYRPYSTIKRIEYLLAITDTRIRQSHYMDPFHSQISKILSVFMKVHDITKYQKHFPPSVPIVSDKFIENNERMYFNLFLRIIDGTIDTEEDQLKIGKELVNLDTPITNFYSAYISSLLMVRKRKETDEVKLNETMYYSLLYHVYSLYATFNPLEVVYITSSESTIDTMQREKIIRELKALYVEDMLSSELISEFTAELVGPLIMSLKQTYQTKKLCVYIQYAREPVGSAIIKKAIYNVFNEKSIQFVSSIEETDIFISDSVEDLSLTKHFFFFEDVRLMECWESLFKFLNEKIYTNYTSK